MADPTLRGLMVNTKVSALVKPHAVVTLAPDTTVEMALASLASHKVLSAPIVAKVREMEIREVEKEGERAAHAARVPARATGRQATRASARKGGEG